MINQHTLCLGDFYIKINNKFCPFAPFFIRILIITHSNSKIVSEISCFTLFSDHFAIIFNINCSKRKPIRKIINYRRLSKIHIPIAISDFNHYLFLQSLLHCLLRMTILLINHYMQTSTCKPVQTSQNLHKDTIVNVKLSLI